MYLSEEIQKEQRVRNLNPFRYVLEIAAQYNGKIINYSGVGKGIGVDPKTVASYYGDIFEQFVFNEIKVISSYKKNDYRISFYHDENGIEVDFVVERPSKPLLFIEVKSSESVNEDMTKNLRVVAKDFSDAEFQLWSRDRVAKILGKVLCLPWETGLQQFI